MNTPKWYSKMTDPRWLLAPAEALAAASNMLSGLVVSTRVPKEYGITQYSHGGAYDHYGDVVFINHLRSSPATLIHEIAHWTGHRSRLARWPITAPLSWWEPRSYEDGEPDIQHEEAIACAVTEILCNQWGINPWGCGMENSIAWEDPPPEMEAVGQVLSYLDSWIQCVELFPEIPSVYQITRRV